MANLNTTLKDAAYVTVGLGVLGFQRAQVRRVELLKQLAAQRKLVEAQFTEATKAAKAASGQMTEGTKAVGKLARDLDGRLAPVRQQVEQRIDAFEGRLPGQARELVRQARTTARQTQTQVRSRLGLDGTSA